MSPSEIAPGLFVRGIVPPLKLADYKLIAFDMDSTLINIECVDEIADIAGRKAEVAAITEAAMRGEIADYKDSLRRRVAMLAGVPEAAYIEPEILKVDAQIQQVTRVLRTMLDHARQPSGLEVVNLAEKVHRIRRRRNVTTGYRAGRHPYRRRHRVRGGVHS